MYRPLRILFTTLTILSLLLCLATIILWTRSYWRADAIGWSRPPSAARERPFIELESGGGGLAISVGAYSPAMDLPGMQAGGFWRSYDGRPIPYAVGRPASRVGFGSSTFRFATFHGRRVVFPTALPAAVFAALPAGRLAVVIRRRRRLGAGQCVNCGYDLRATPDRCPECGRAPAGQAGAGLQPARHMRAG